ncbi:MAG TPA: multidrug effflux MFS transporter [Candidatus Sulfotelmatobacter sp.]|jgi:DHA1 family bicyclomycin/chloramphenicol resistance-like MFS transporter|nr:multidrug effflux MFS transporter [Candidatus Sulfotelmatobacter sp.]
MTEFPAATEASAAKRPPLYMLIALTAFGPMSIDLYLPSMPDLTRVFHAEISRVELTLSVFLVGFALAQLVYGPLSDRYGRRPVLLVGLALYSFASLFCLTAQNVNMLILGRFLQSLGACCGPVLSRAILRDSFPRERVARVMASLATVMALAPAIAPLIGGNLHALFGWQANFVLLVGFGALVFGMTWGLLPETNRNLNLQALHPMALVENYLKLLRDRVFLGYSLTVSFFFGTMFSFISGSAFVIIDVLKVPPEHFGFCFGAPVLGLMAGSFVSAKLAHKVGLERMVKIGCLVGTGFGLLMFGVSLAGLETVVSVVGPVIGIYVAAGLVLPNSTALAIAPHARIAGSASALLGCLQMGIASLTGWLVGLFHDGTGLSMAGIIAASVVLAAMFRWLVIPRTS